VLAYFGRIPKLFGFFKCGSNLELNLKNETVLKSAHIRPSFFYLFFLNFYHHPSSPFSSQKIIWFQLVSRMQNCAVVSLGGITWDGQNNLVFSRFWQNSRFSFKNQ